MTVYIKECTGCHKEFKTSADKKLKCNDCVKKDSKKKHYERMKQKNQDGVSHVWAKRKERMHSFREPVAIYCKNCGSYIETTNVVMYNKNYYCCTMCKNDYEKEVKTKRQARYREKLKKLIALGKEMMKGTDNG